MNNPLATDAPIAALLSLSDNPKIGEMSTEELTAYLAELRRLHQQPMVLAAKVSREAKPRTPRAAANAERQRKLDLL